MPHHIVETTDIYCLHWRKVVPREKRLTGPWLSISKENRKLEHPTDSILKFMWYRTYPLVSPSIPKQNFFDLLVFLDISALPTIIAYYDAFLFLLFFFYLQFCILFTKLVFFVILYTIYRCWLLFNSNQRCTSTCQVSSISQYKVFWSTKWCKIAPCSLYSKLKNM